MRISLTEDRAILPPPFKALLHEQFNGATKILFTFYGEGIWSADCLVGNKKVELTGHYFTDDWQIDDIKEN